MFSVRIIMAANDYNKNIDGAVRKMLYIIIPHLIIHKFPACFCFLINTNNLEEKVLTKTPPEYGFMLLFITFIEQ